MNRVFFLFLSVKSDREFNFVAILSVKIVLCVCSGQHVQHAGVGVRVADGVATAGHPQRPGPPLAAQAARALALARYTPDSLAFVTFASSAQKRKNEERSDF